MVPPPVSVIPSLWDFGNTLVGQRSGVKSFSVVNPGAVPVAIGVPSTSGPFQVVSTNCAATVPPGLHCDVDVAFAPGQSGFAVGTLFVPTTAGGPAVLAPKRGISKVLTDGPPPGATASLAGTGTQAAALQMPSAITMPAYVVGSPPVFQLVTLTNGGNAVLTFSSISTAAPFTVVNNCPTNLAPGDSCTVNVGFSATTVGPFNGTLTVVSNAPGGSRAVPITAVSQTVAAPLIHVAPTFIGFGARMFGTQSDSQRITIVNDGGAAATLSTLSVGVDYLLVGTTCGLTLAPAATCFADVAFRPLGFGPRSGQFSFSSNSTGSPHAVDMLGTGCRPFTVSGRAGAGNACAP